MSIKYTLYTRQIEVLHVISYMRVRGLLGTLFSIKILDQRARLLSRLNRRPGRESSLGPSRRVAPLSYWIIGIGSWSGCLSREAITCYDKRCGALILARLVDLVGRATRDLPKNQKKKTKKFQAMRC